MRISLLKQQVYPLKEKLRVLVALENIMIDHCEMQSLHIIPCGCKYKVDNDMITVTLCERAKNGAKATT